MGVWNYVHGNLIGPRVPYNTDEEVPAERFVRAWEILKDGQGRPYDTKEKVVGQKFLKNADNGMYVRHSDLVKFAKAQGWKKDGGWPAKNQAAGGLDIAAIVAAVMARDAGEPAATGSCSTYARDPGNCHGRAEDPFSKPART